VATAVINIIAYLYGRPVAEKLRRRQIDVEYNKAGRIRRVYVDGKLAFVLRNNDGYLLPTLYGATFLERRLVLDPEAVEYVKEGRNVPAKYIVQAPQEGETLRRSRGGRPPRLGDSRRETYVQR